MGCGWSSKVADSTKNKASSTEAKPLEGDDPEELDNDIRIERIKSAAKERIENGVEGKELTLRDRGPSKGNLSLSIRN